MTDWTGARIRFEVTDVAPESVSGDRIRVGTGQILSISKKETSLEPVGAGIGEALKGVFGLAYLVASLLPVGIVFVT